MLCLRPNTPSVSTGPCPLTVAGPYSAWMPRKSLHGRTCGVSCDGGGQGPCSTLAVSRARCPHRTRPLVGAHLRSCLSCCLHQTRSRCVMIERGASSTALPCTPTISTGPCRPTVAGP
ncbi:hypothetical protein XaCFBP7622_01970 [Xanthomonas arboricola]|nr:hypothetical protein XaCFBP7622_01970 [Xanthomonas arboricola]